MTRVDLPRPARVLAVGAHPDDVEFGCGATLAKWATEGAHCELLVLTDGSKGTWDAHADIGELVARRRDEQRAAAEVLGIAAVHFGNAVDGELENTVDIRREVCRAIRTAQPDVVLGHDPWKRYRLHPDHHAAGRLVVDGVVAARDPHFFPEAGVPHRPSALLLFESEEVDHIETAGAAGQLAKLTALLEHRSQWRSTMGIEEEADGQPVTQHVKDFTFRLSRDYASMPGHDGAVGEPFKLIIDL